MQLTTHIKVVIDVRGAGRRLTWVQLKDDACGQLSVLAVLWIEMHVVQQSLGTCDQPRARGVFVFVSAGHDHSLTVGTDREVNDDAACLCETNRARGIVRVE